MKICIFQSVKVSGKRDNTFYKEIEYESDLIHTEYDEALNHTVKDPYIEPFDSIWTNKKRIVSCHKRSPIVVYPNTKGIPFTEVWVENCIVDELSYRDLEKKYLENGWKKDYE